MLEARDYEGIYFSHMPRCGGTYLSTALRALCEKAGLEFINGGHQWSFGEGPDPEPSLRSGKIYRSVPKNYLKVSSVRHPITLLHSLYFYKDRGRARGYANIQDHFPSFEKFISNFCLMSHFDAVTNAGHVWTYTLEKAKFCVDERDQSIVKPVDVTEEDPRLTKERSYFCIRPLAFSRNRCGLPGEVIEMLKDHYADNSVLHCFEPLVDKAGSVVPWCYQRRFNESSAWPVWPSHVQTTMELHLQLDLLNQLSCFNVDYELEEMRRYWYFTGFMWNPLFDWTTGTSYADVILRLENIEGGLSFLYDFFGVKRDDNPEDHDKNEGSRHDYEKTYSGAMINLIGATQGLALDTFGYRIDRLTRVDARPVIFGKDISVDFLPEPGTLLDLKWEL